MRGMLNCAAPPSLCLVPSTFIVQCATFKRNPPLILSHTRIHPTMLSSNLVLVAALVTLFTLQCCFTCCFAMSRTDPEVDNLIRKYWSRYKKIAVILAYLRIVHKVSIGMTWLKARLKYLGLCRRGSRVNYSPVPQVQAAIEKELKGCNSNVGYRQMWTILKEKHGMVVKRSTVQMLMSLLDDGGVSRRRGRRLKRRVYQNKGPDFVWHLDGYDKLKPYGFTIHGCIDGYSRKIIWLELATTNNDPNVILLYYLLAILRNKGCPCIVRSDCGTENTSLAACHMALRDAHQDDFKGEKSFRFGSSTTNTRIESWWAQLRKSVSDWWMNIFKDMIQDGDFNPHNEIHRHCLAFVYCPLIKVALEDFKNRWNSHRIRPNRMAGCPAGVPEDLYQLPQLSGTRSFKQPVDLLVWSHCFLEEAYKAPPFYSSEFEAVAIAILEDMNTTTADITQENAKAIYLHLCNVLS